MDKSELISRLEKRRDQIQAKTYGDYLEVKRMVLEEHATTNFIMERLNVPIFVARCLIKDWLTEKEIDL